MSKQDVNQHMLAIAHVVHDAVRAWEQESNLNDGVDKPWVKLTEAEKDEIVGKVRLHLTSPHSGDAAVHTAWMTKMKEQGWSAGPSYDEKRKVHPDVVPYHMLPHKQQARARLLRAVVLSLSRV